MASSSSPCRVYQIHHKCFSNNHKFEIFNSENEIEYLVHSNGLLFLSDKMFVRESSTEKDLIQIQRENVHIHSRYDISKFNQNDQQHLATIKKISDQHHFHHSFEIDSIYGVYHVERQHILFDHQFKLTTGDKIVVNVYKNTETNIYHVQINDDDGGDLFLLAVVIAISCALRCPHS